MRASRWLEFDFVMLGCVLALSAMGIGMIHSATCGTPCQGVLPLSSYAIRQLVSAVIGLALMLGISLVDYRLYRAYAFHLYAVGVILLILVLLIGRTGADNNYGSRRWIYIGSFGLQASEAAKLAVLVGLARVLGDKGDGPLSFKRLLASLVMVLIPSALIFAEPDLGTALSFIAVWLTLAYLSRMQVRQVVLLNMCGVLALPLAWFGMRGYMRDRVMTFIQTIGDSSKASLSEGYNVLQARISIGSGGLLGRGYLEGTQTQLDYLRIKQSDFIFSALAEELGFVGAAILFGLLLVLIMRITRAADLAQDHFGRLLCFGVATMLLFQAAANLASNLTLVPVTGIPLPFISYGGSSLVMIMLSLGVVQSVRLYRHRYRF